MTWYFDASGQTLDTIHWTGGQGNTFDVASDVPFSGSWSDPAPDTAIAEAAAWIKDQAAEGNTQTAVTALADLLAEDWTEGTP